MSHYIVGVIIPKEAVAVNTFERALNEAMDPFYEQTENDKYLKFVDCTKEVENAWQNETTCGVKMSDGSIVQKYSGKIIGYDINEKTGEIKKRDNSFNHQASGYGDEQRLIPIEVIQECSVQKCYGSFEEYCQDYYGYYIQPDGKIGYTTNPFSLYDYYCLSGEGRFGDAIILKGSGKKTSYSVIHNIDWEAMSKELTEELQTSYNFLQSLFKKNVNPEKVDTAFYRVEDDKVYHLFGGSEPVAYKDEPFENYLRRHNVYEGSKPLGCYTLIDRNGTVHAHGTMGWFGMSKDDKTNDEWNSEVTKIIDSSDPEDMLVLLDCHI